MTQEHLTLFFDYLKDHLEHFDCVPLEFEVSEEKIYGQQECWEAYLYFVDRGLI
jgi:hypothetical protein